MTTKQSDRDALPPLPDPYAKVERWVKCVLSPHDAFSADQMRDYALAAIAAASPIQAEPVAWRLRGYSQFKTGTPGPWRYSTGPKMPPANVPSDCDFEPLYAAPQPPAQAALPVVAEPILPLLHKTKNALFSLRGSVGHPDNVAIANWAISEIDKYLSSAQVGDELPPEPVVYGFEWDQKRHKYQISSVMAEPTDDEVIDVAVALERRRILEEIKKAAALYPLDDMPTPFQSAWRGCCEELWFRTTEGDSYFDVENCTSPLIAPPSQVGDKATELTEADIVALLDHHKTHFSYQEQRMPNAMRSFIEGMSVSVDVSTCEENSSNRYYGVVSEVMDDEFDKHGVTLLVQNSEPNFKLPIEQLEKALLALPPLLAKHGTYIKLDSAIEAVRQILNGEIKDA